MIMVGPGTGVAPLLAFCEREEVLQQRRSDCMLFFGSRKEADHLARERMEAWLKGRTLSSLDVAYSRVGPNKVREQCNWLPH
jgi:sulfite reductase alpha subunit-like flavoprotein